MPRVGFLTLFVLIKLNKDSKQYADKTLSATAEFRLSELQFFKKCADSLGPYWCIWKNQRLKKLKVFAKLRFTNEELKNHAFMKIILAVCHTLVFVVVKTSMSETTQVDQRNCARCTTSYVSKAYISKIVKYACASQGLQTFLSEDCIS